MKPPPDRKRTKYTLPKTHKPEATTRRETPKAGPPTPKRSAPAPAKQPGPYRDSERKAVAEHKKTPTYRAAIKVAYRSRPLAARQKRVSEIANKLSGPRRIEGRGRLSVEDTAVLDTYLRRAARDEKLMKSPVYTDRQRKIVEGHKATPSYQDALLEARYPVTDKRYKHLFETDPAKLRKAGFTPDLGDKVSRVVMGPLTSAGAVAEGLYKDPLGVPLKTAKSLPLALAAAPVAAVNTVLHPVKTVEAVAESLGTGYEDKVKRVRESGALEDIGNAAITVGPSGSAAGRFLTRGAVRAEKLQSGTLTKTPKTGGAVRYTVGSKLDNAKAARLERRAASGKPLTALQNEALQRNRKAGRTVAVVPMRSAPTIRRAGVAVARGRGVAALRYARARGPVAKLAKAKYRLNDAEKQALWAAMEGGIHTPEAARTHLPTLIAKMEESRTAEPRGWEKDMDVVAQLKEIAQAPEKHFTPNLRAVLADIEKYTDAISDAEPQFKDVTKQGRRRAVQQYLLDLEPGETPAKPHISAAMVAAASRNGNGNAPDEPSGFFRGTHDPAAVLRSRDATPEDRELWRLPAAWATTDRKEASTYGPHVEEVTHSMRNPYRVELRPTPGDPGMEIAESLGVHVDGDEPLDVAQLVRDRGYDGVIIDWTDGRRWAAALDGLEARRTPAVPALKYTPETPEAFFDRIDETAGAAGLAKPMYFKSEKQRGMQHDFSAAVAGGGKAKSTGKPFEGKNLGEGIFDTSYEQMLRGYEHNVKARHNYDLVIELNRRNRLDSVVSEPQGVTVGEALNRINRSEPRLDKESFALVNPGIFERHVDENPGTDLERADDADAMDSGLPDALAKSTITDLNNPDADLLRTPGWQVWPKEALRELERELTSSSAGGRAFDIVKGNLSKAILVTGNIPWLAIQFVSEVSMTGIMSKGRALTPRNMAGTVKWWKAMNDQQRGEVAGAMGVGATAADMQVVKMGSSIHKGFGHTWRGFKSQDLWHAPRVAGQPIAHIINPMKWLRAADQGKTNATRLLYAHAELTKKLPKDRVPIVADAMKGMADTAKSVDRLLPVFEKPAKEQLEYLSAHPEILEDLATNLNDALGDWTTLTASERLWTNRFIMFYPFVRYSTRLVLYTMPVDHPAIAALLAELGELQAQEYREIFGDDDLPWNLGKVYFGAPGEGNSIDLTRANPLMNSMVAGAARIGTNSANTVGAAVGMTPPYFQWLVEHAGWSTFKGRPTRFAGDTSPIPLKPWQVGLEEHGKLALAELQSLMYPAREAMQRLHPGSQSDESSLLFPVPMNYKPASSYDGEGLGDEIARRSAANAIANQELAEENQGGLLDAAFGPLVPKPSRDAASSRERAYIKKLKAEQERRRKQPGRAGGKPKTPFKARGGGKLFKSQGSNGLFKDR